MSTPTHTPGPIPLYHHKTSGGAEYLTDAFVEWQHNGESGREGVFEGAKYIVRLDGQPTLTVDNAHLIAAAPELLAMLQRVLHPMASEDDIDEARALLDRLNREGVK